MKLIKLKIGDIFVYIFIVLLIAFSFLGLKSMGNYQGETMVQIELDGKLIEEIEILDREFDGESRELRIDTGEGGYNTIRISTEGVAILDANCPDKLCVHSPTIKVPGQSIVCIPHKLIVRITGESRPDNNAVDDTAS